jgi:hypothetical protein
MIMQSGKIGLAVRLVVVAAAFAALSSCATLNEDECSSVDWGALGQKNGAEGRSADFIQRHEKSCSRYKLPVNQSAWRQGWETGIRQYCTPRNGLSQGRAGHAYAGSCPSDVALGFEDAYRIGRNVYDAEQERQRLENEIDSLRDQRDDEEDRNERRELERRIGDTRDRLYDAERRERFAERRYDRYVFEHQLVD